jgi:hypothetical protein
MLESGALLVSPSTTCEPGSKVSPILHSAKLSTWLGFSEFPLAIYSLQIHLTRVFQFQIFARSQIEHLPNIVPSLRMC